MTFLNPQQQHTLSLLCETFVPALEDAPEGLRWGARDIGLPAALEIALERVMDRNRQRQFCLFLDSLERASFNRLTVGIAKPFRAMNPEERTQLLRAWKDSDHALARQTFQGIKRLALFLAYSLLPDGETHPAYTALGYHGAPKVDPSPKPIQPERIDTDLRLSADVLIIGSGAGGGVVAGELSAAGYDVIVAEKGEYWDGADFHGRELESTERLFEKFGSLTTDDLAVLILAGSTLGGGTTINWAGSLRTPAEVLDEWASSYGFTGAASPEFQASLDAVCARLNVHDHVPNNGVNSVLEAGCAALGYHVSPIPRNTHGCEDCGFCNFGCAYGAKRSTARTYLQDMADRGGRILVGAYCEQLLIERGRAAGAVFSVRGTDGSLYTVMVRAKLVVVSAGAIHTPALLLRSGLQNAHIGANLRLHPTTMVYGIYEQPMRGWQGIGMGRVLHQFANLDGSGYGFRLETAPIHPGIAALSLAWESGRQHKQQMAQLENTADTIVLTRDRYGGRVTIDRNGQPVIRYRLHPYDARHMMQGMITALRVQHAAGAIEVASGHARHLVWRAQPRHEVGRWDSFEAFLTAVENEGLRTNAFALYSAHQMASCRIGATTAMGALDPTGQTYEVDRLFVADASVMPTPSGVNPMITIMATAHYLAQGMKAVL